MRGVKGCVKQRTHLHRSLERLVPTRTRGEAANPGARRGSARPADRALRVLHVRSRAG